MMFRQISLTFVLVILVVALGAFFRFFALGTVPPGIYPDEATNGVNALQALDTGDFKVFYTDNNGREGLFINIQAIAIQMFGATPQVLRSVSAVMGTLTVLALYFAARELMLWRNATHEQRTARVIEFKGRSISLPTFEELVALTASFFLAVSLWHVNFSRIGFRAIMVPLLTSAGIALLVRGIRLRHTAEFLGAGAAFGLLLATYIGGRFAFFILPILFAMDAIIALRSGHTIKKFLVPWILFGMALLITALPIIGYFAVHPDDFFGRASGVSIFATEHPIQNLAVSVEKTLLMFHIRGDGNWRHNLSGWPQLNTIIGIFMLVGIAWLLRRWQRGRLRSLTDWFPDLVLYIWFGLMLLPTLLSAEGIPHALRAIGSIAPALIFAGEGFGVLWKKMRVHLDRRTAVSLALALLTFVGGMEFYRYFFLWASNPNIQGAFRTDLTADAAYLNQLPHDAKRIVIVNESGVLLDGIPMPSAAVRFLTEDDLSIQYLTPERLSEIDPNFDHTWILVTLPPDQNLDESLKAQFPSIQRISENPTIYHL